MDKKQLRRSLGAAGWIALVYHLILVACVMVTVIVEMIINLMGAVSGGFDMNTMMNAMMAAFTSAWGYFVGAGVGLIILLVWKKPRYWKEEIWKKGKPMKAGAFWGILSIFLSVQVVYQIYAMAIELLFNGMGLSILEGMERASLDTGVLSMFLYAGVLAPVSEELLFRGLIQRTLIPYGRKLAILGSAFLFGMMHGNIFQTPFAFLTGLVLGWVATEYSIAWAMLLHMINNLVLGDMLTRLTSGMGELGMMAVVWIILGICLIGAIVTVIRRRREISAWMRANTMGPSYVRCFFTSAGVVTFTVLMSLSIIFLLFMLATPM